MPSWYIGQQLHHLARPNHCICRSLNSPKMQQVRNHGNTQLTVYTVYTDSRAYRGCLASQGQATICATWDPQMPHLLRCAGVQEGYQYIEKLVDILNTEFDTVDCKASRNGAKPSTGQAGEATTAAAKASRTRHLVRINSLLPVAGLFRQTSMRSAL